MPPGRVALHLGKAICTTLLRQLPCDPRTDRDCCTNVEQIELPEIQLRKARRCWLRGIVHQWSGNRLCRYVPDMLICCRNLTFTSIEQRLQNLSSHCHFRLRPLCYCDRSFHEAARSLASPFGSDEIVDIAPGPGYTTAQEVEVVRSGEITGIKHRLQIGDDVAQPTVDIRLWLGSGHEDRIPARLGRTVELWTARTTAPSPGSSTRMAEKETLFRAARGYYRRIRRGRLHAGFGHDAGTTPKSVIQFSEKYRA